MRMYVTIGVVILQLLVLAYMAGEREWIARWGKVVQVQTAPLDPRDPFRGNYVRLDYAINQLPNELLRGGLTNAGTGDRPSVRGGKPVYAVLRCADGLVTGVEYVTDRRPTTGLFLRGQAAPRWSGQNVTTVEYGIEAYFMQEDKARELETQRRRENIQVPLVMDVAISGKGVAVLKGHAWSPLGVGVRFENMTLTNRLSAVRRAFVQLVNVSSNDLALVALPDGGSLALEYDSRRSWLGGDETWVAAAAARPAVTDADVVVLKPGEQREIAVDFMQPRWFVSHNGGTPRSLTDLPNGLMFRLIYRPPSREACRHLRQAAQIWHGELPGAAFAAGSGGGRVD